MKFIRNNIFLFILVLLIVSCFFVSCSKMNDSSINESSTTINIESVNNIEYHFRNDNLLKKHFEKHGKEMGFDTQQEYEKAASKVVNDPNSLHKIEKEDGDDVYYLEATNEFVVLSSDGYLRTYFYPSKGLEYFNNQ